jgi:hypothetical protein
MPLAPNSATLANPPTVVYAGGMVNTAMPRIKLPDGRTIDTPHPEWTRQQLRWRFLLDSWEGGEVYRMAIYGFDVHGMPIRNMIRHKREYPAAHDSNWGLMGRPPGTDPSNQATDDDYELRRARTPVPGFVAEVVDRHLGKIYKKEVKRDGPTAIMEWWQDVDGRGTSMDQWMAETIAPLLLVLGQIDICLDHPALPDGEEARSRADEMRLGLDAVVATYILPENLEWWVLDERGHYEEVLIREVRDDQSVQWCYWNEEVYVRYDAEGDLIGSVTDHDYGEVPIIRIFDRRRPRSCNVGLPRYEMIAEMQREYYNRDSELILSDTTQAHPLLQGPEDFVQPDGTIPIGPNWLLPKKKNMAGATAVYEGFEVVQFPKDGADSIRMNLDRLRDGVDRLAGLTKPAGAAGIQGQTVSQSGISKQMDADIGHDLLGNISKTLERAEGAIAELFWFVEGNGDPQEELAAETRIQYATEFNLQSAQEIGQITDRFQQVIGSGGKAPLIEGKLIERFVRQAISGLDDEEYAAMVKEIQAVLTQGQEMEQKAIEANKRALTDQANGVYQMPDNPDEPTG